MDKDSRLEVLHELTGVLIRSNDGAQETYLHQYLSLAKDLEEYDKLASRSRFLIQFYIYQNNLEKAQKLIDSFLGFKPYFYIENSEAHLLLKRASIFYLNEKSDETIQDYMESARLFLKSGDSIFAADAYYFSGQAYSNKSDFVGAIKCYREAIELYEILGDQQYALIVGSEASGLYSRNGFVEKGLEERKRLLEKSIELNDLPAQAQIVGQNVVDYYRLEKFTEMDIQLRKLKKIVDGGLDRVSPDQHMFYHLAYLNYKLILECERKNIAESRELMKQLTQKTKSKELGQYLETGILAAKSDYYALINDQKNLLPILNKLANIKTTNRFGAQIKARERLATIYKGKGKLKQALELN